VKPGDVLTCTACGETATAYTTGDPARWKEGEPLLVSWGRGVHVATREELTLCPPCEEEARGGAPRAEWKPPTRRVAICDELARHGCRTDGFDLNTDALVEEAYQRWVAAGRPRCVLVAVETHGTDLTEFMNLRISKPAPSPPAAAALERFEQDAAAFHRETGMLAPGKDQPAAMGGAPSDEERQEAWVAWLRKRNAAEAPPRAAPKPKAGQLGLF
jgi:hypothetical protein